MNELTSNGRVWAEKHLSRSQVARVALLRPHQSGWPAGHVDTAIKVCNEEGERAVRLTTLLPVTRDDWPVHQPECFDAPIPGRQWYSGCDDSRARVDPATGRCESCGSVACRECGRENCPDHDGTSDDVRVLLDGLGVASLSELHAIVEAHHTNQKGR